MTGREQLVTTDELAAHLKDVPPKTLAEWRSRGVGPRYIKVGRYVRYRWADVLAWEASRTVETGRTA
jgi:hypothetical protein